MSIEIALAIALTGGQGAPNGLPFVSPMFGDHMVLQRDKKNVIWGWSNPGDEVTVSLGGKSASAKAGPDGKWTVKIDPPKVGGPYELTVEGDRKVTFKDVLVGDVWVCSGQSNMEMGLLETDNGPAVMKAANHPNIRLFLIKQNVSYTPAPLADAKWAVCSADTIGQGGWGGFSAVGYYFGRMLNRELGVPVGLVQAAWGGTAAEAWASESGLQTLKDFDNVIAKIQKDRAEGAPASGTLADLWIKEKANATKVASPSLDDSNWVETSIPSDFKAVNPQQNPGLVAFRKTVNLTSIPDGETFVRIGGLPNANWTYQHYTFVNGVRVGAAGTWDAWLRVPNSLLKVGANQITILVNDDAGTVGFKPTTFHVRLGDSSEVALGGTWKSKFLVDARATGDRPKDYSPAPNLPGVLFNGMLAPTFPMAIRGAIWYQGETNGGRGYQYRKLLPQMIADWRKAYGQGDFPFYIVSLAAFGQPVQKPGDDGWAELREAQYLTAKNVKNAGLAITTDVGDPTDIHPKNKKAVGERLALVALAKEFNKSVEYSGPEYAGMKVQGAKVQLSFKHVEGGLVAKTKDNLGFQIAGADKVWHWASAEIKGDTVEVWSDKVAAPAAVRYAWAGYPKAGLFNGVGLPAIPFRTDDWPGVSINNK